MLCHYYRTIMLLLLAPFSIDSHFKLGSVSSMTVAHWKRKMGNALHFLHLLYECCYLQAASIDKTFSSFSVSSEILLSQVFLKYHDIILQYPPLLWTFILDNPKLYIGNKLSTCVLCHTHHLCSLKYSFYELIQNSRGALFWGLLCLDFGFPFVLLP